MSNTDYAAIYAEAATAAKAAADAKVPVPMLVGTAKSLFDDTIDETQTIYYVSQGVCGFASIRFKGNTGFGKWAKSVGHAKPGYPNGLAIYVHEGGQSYEIKVAYADAFVAVLNAHGIDSWTESRLD